MRILVSPDSFKGSLDARRAAFAVMRGVHKALPSARVVLLPVADGGEGTLDAMGASAIRASRLWTRGPMGSPVRARYLELRNRTALVEMAQAAGLLLVPPKRRNPARASTWGVGELIDAAVRNGARRVVVTIGGSATVDCGAGMAQALGARLLDARGRPIAPGGEGLLGLASIDTGPLRRRMRGVTVRGATDVTCPLLGPLGARLFTRQKGATPAQMRLLDRALANFARVARRDLGVAVAALPGAGAAGGLGAGLVAFLGARLVSGAETILDLLGFDAALRRADMVITGEGSLDGQTAHGKLVARVAARARRARVPVYAFAGRVSLSPAGVRKLGLAGAWGLMEQGVTERESVKRAAELLEERTRKALADPAFRPG